MPWFRVDDKLHDHRKAHAAKKSAMGVWVLAGSWCMDNLEDGFIPARVLPRWGTKADAARLVEVGLWEKAERDGEPGWTFVNWHEFQPSKADVEAERAATKERVKAWRAKRRNAEGNDVGNGVTPGVRNAVSNAAPSRPVPTRPLSVVTSPVSPETAPRELDDDGLTRIRQALNGCPEAHARRTAAFVLAKAPTDVRNPTAYVLAAIADEPEAYRYRRGSPSRAQECSDHPGEWADACRAHAIDARLGGDR